MKLFLKIYLLALLLALPAQAEEGDSSPPPQATSQSTWLFSWTNNPSALSDPAGNVESKLAHAQDCVAKISAAARAGKDEEITGCEGNEMAAGPGIYTCDNPFTSHDYGNAVIAMKTKPGNRGVANISGLLRPADTIDRSVSGNSNYAAILYDFRATDRGGYALAVRDLNILDQSQTTAFKVPSGDYQEFHSHSPFACNSQSSVKDVLSHWGDQLDFLSLTYDFFRDPSGANFEKNSQLNEAGLMAALASNIVAVPEAELQSKLKKLTSSNAELKDHLSTESCSEAERATPRMCLAYEIFDSLVGNEGTPNHPNYSWTFPALKTAMLKLGIIDTATAAKFKNRDAMASFLAARFLRDSSQAQRAQEAFGCM
ncbi:MAG: hypothetical protein ACXVBE_07840, partial [Bdellovibrionota bacterium]